MEGIKSHETHEMTSAIAIQNAISEEEAQKTTMIAINKDNILAETTTGSITGSSTSESRVPRTEGQIIEQPIEQNNKIIKQTVTTDPAMIQAQQAKREKEEPGYFADTTIWSLVELMCEHPGDITSDDDDSELLGWDEYHWDRKGKRKRNRNDLEEAEQLNEQNTETSPKQGEGEASKAMTEHVQGEPKGQRADRLYVEQRDEDTGVTIEFPKLNSVDATSPYAETKPKLHGIETSNLDRRDQIEIRNYTAVPDVQYSSTAEQYIMEGHTNQSKHVETPEQQFAQRYPIPPYISAVSQYPYLNPALSVPPVPYYPSPTIMEAEGRHSAYSSQQLYPPLPEIPHLGNSPVTMPAMLGNVAATQKQPSSPLSEIQFPPLKSPMMRSSTTHNKYNLPDRISAATPKLMMPHMRAHRLSCDVVSRRPSVDDIKHNTEIMQRMKIPDAKLPKSSSVSSPGIATVADKQTSTEEKSSATQHGLRRASQQLKEMQEPLELPQQVTEASSRVPPPSAMQHPPSHYVPPPIPPYSPVAQMSSPLSAGPMGSIEHLQNLAMMSQSAAIHHMKYNTPRSRPGNPPSEPFLAAAAAAWTQQEMYRQALLNPRFSQGKCRKYPNCPFGDRCKFYHDSGSNPGPYVTPGYSPNPHSNYGWSEMDNRRRSMQEKCYTEICRNFPNCKYGLNCTFLHPVPKQFSPEETDSNDDTKENSAPYNYSVSDIRPNKVVESRKESFGAIPVSSQLQLSGEDSDDDASFATAEGDPCDFMS